VTIRRILIGLFIVAFAVAGWVVAQDKPAADQDEPPVRLKKKEKPPPKDEAVKPPEKEVPAKPAAEEKKPEDRIKDEKIKKDDDQPEPGDEPELDPQQVLNRALKNSRTVEERLANKEVGDGTKQLQRDILKDLDSLIEEHKRQQQDQAEAQNQDQQQDKQNGPGKQGQQQAGNMGGKQGQRPQQGSGGQRGSRRTQTVRRRGQGSGQSQQAMGQGQKSQGGNSKSPEGGMGGNGGAEEMNKLAEVYKDIWGELPKALRQEMDAYSREEFMTKYKDVLKQYYATVAEKGRHKD
jgi:hypothetical protein